MRWPGSSIRVQTTAEEEVMGFERVHESLKSFFSARPDFFRIHQKVAERMGRGFLRCSNCHKVEELSLEKVEKYLREGWPKCCQGTYAGGTMGYYSEKERGRFKR
jgi:hypothetical protein